MSLGGARPACSRVGSPLVAGRGFRDGQPAAPLPSPESANLPLQQICSVKLKCHASEPFARLFPFNLREDSVSVTRCEVDRCGEYLDFFFSRLLVTCMI